MPPCACPPSKGTAATAASVSASPTPLVPRIASTRCAGPAPARDEVRGAEGLRRPRRLHDVAPPEPGRGEHRGSVTGVTPAPRVRGVSVGGADAPAHIGGGARAPTHINHIQTRALTVTLAQTRVQTLTPCTHSHAQPHARASTCARMRARTQDAHTYKYKTSESKRNTPITATATATARTTTTDQNMDHMHNNCCTNKTRSHTSSNACCCTDDMPLQVFTLPCAAHVARIPFRNSGPELPLREQRSVTHDII